MEATDSAEIEVLEDEPAILPPTTGAPRLRWIAALLAAVVGAAVVLAVLGDDDPVAAPPPASPGIFELDRVEPENSPPSSQTTYPVLGREWGLTALWVQQAGIVAFDLDTGHSRVVIPTDDSVARAGWNQVAVVHDVLHIGFGRNGVARAGRDGTTVVRDDTSDPSTRLVGGFLVSAFGLGPSWRMEHVATGEPVDIADADWFALLDDTVLVERGGSILAVAPPGPSRLWAGGELVAAGNGAAVHRRCDADSCTAFAGTADDPDALALDADAVRAHGIENALTRSGGGGPLPGFASPDGRYLTTSTGTERGQLAVADLVTGAVVPIDDGFPTAWLPDASAYATVIAPSITIVSMSDGSAARLPVLSEAGARRGSSVVFVPTDELPEVLFGE